MMDAIMCLCYRFYFTKGGVKNAVSADDNKDIDDSINLWIGLSAGRHYYRLSVKDSDEFLNKYLVK